MAKKQHDTALGPARRGRNLVPAALPESRAPFSRPVRPVMPPSEEESLELRRLILVLLKRKWEVLLVAALLVIPVAAATALAERLYRSTALIQIDPEPVQVLPYREIDTPSIIQNYDMFMKSQEQILRGPTLVQRIENNLRERSDAPKLKAEIPRLSKRLSIQRLETTQMFRLMYVAGEPETAAAVANVFAEEYIKLQFETRQTTRKRARELLERELEALEQRVQVSEKDLVAYAQRHSITTADAGQNLVQQKLRQLSTQLSDGEAEVFVAQSRLDSLKKASVAEFPERLVSPVISTLVSTLASLEHELTALRASFGENWPAVRQKRSEMALVRDQLEREKASALTQARDQAQLDLGAADSKRRMIRSSMTEQQGLADRLQNATIQYNIIRREVETSQRIYDGLLERLKQTSVTTGMEFGGFKVVEPARPSDEVDSPKVLWNLSLASVLGLALGICIAFARDFWNTATATVEDVEQLTDMPVLGTLPLVRLDSAITTRRLARGIALLPRPLRGLLEAPQQRSRPEADGPAASAADEAQSPEVVTATGADTSTARLPRRFSADRIAEEGVRNVCASILLSRSGQPPKVLLVTSAAAGEGKTTLATELGYAFAESGARTLLVECDLRRPSFPSIFGVPRSGGLSLYLSGHVNPTPAIHGTANANLFIVGSGPVAPNPPALLGSEKMASFLREMMSSFQFVILDTPPVLPMADARVLARMVEGVVFVVRAGQVPKPMLRRAFTLLEATGANVLGAVLNCADARGAGDSYYRYYHQYYEH